MSHTIENTLIKSIKDLVHYDPKNAIEKIMYSVFECVEKQPLRVTVTSTSES